VVDSLKGNNLSQRIDYKFLGKNFLVKRASQRVLFFMPAQTWLNKSCSMCLNGCNIYLNVNFTFIQNLK